MPYNVVHRTSYVYESTVSASYGMVYLLPRSTDSQHVLRAHMEITPLPDTYGEHDDFFGNRVANFAVLAPHTELTVSTTSLVEVTGCAMPMFGSGPTWEIAKDLTTQRDGGTDLDTPETINVLNARQFLLDSPSIGVSAAVRSYASPSFAPGRQLVDVLSDLTARINRDFEYKPGVTDLATTPEVLLDLRQGVCQDFAHFQIACLRSYGIAARYVSGYLETLPPPGREKLKGADVSHAWLSAFIPTIGWVDVDPTNNLFVSNRHVTTAWGRDYTDVSPLKGVIFTEAKSNTMTVSVDVSFEP